MKSLPEKDFWNVIKSRLEHYKEEPQDDWLKIASVIPPPPPRKHHYHITGAADFLSAASVVILLWTLLATSPATHPVTPDAVATQSALSDKTVHTPASPLKPDTTVHAGFHQNSASQVDEEETVKPAHAAQDASMKNDGSEKLVHETSSDVQPGRESSLITLPAQTNATPAGEPVLTQPFPRGDGGVTIAMLPERDRVRADQQDTVYFAVPPILQQKQKPKRKFRPSVYGMITPSLAYQKVIPLRDDDINIQKLNGAGIVSGDRFGFGMEVGFQMQVSARVELYAALSYYQQHQFVSYSYASATDITVGGTDNPWSYEVSPGEITRRFSYNMRNAGADAGVLYHLRGRKLMHKIGGGLQYHKGFISSQAEYSYNNAASTYLSYQLMYRMEFSLNGRASVFLQPQFIHSIIAYEALREPFDIKPYRAGIGFGLVCHLY